MSKLDKNKMDSICETRQFGVCVKDKDGTVIHQNKISKSICGHLENKSCSQCEFKPFTRLRHFVNDFLFKQGFYFDKGRLIGKTHCDVIKIKDIDKEITYLHPLKKILEGYREIFKEKGLTKKESEIASQVVEGKQNVEIQDSLFISKSTLKTHINNIYKKIPFLKKTRDV